MKRMSRRRMSEIIIRFIDQAGKADAEFYSDSHLEGIMQARLYGNDAIFSYGRHFPLAVIMPDADGNRRGWWLLNGDRYPGSGGWGYSTSGQQTEIQTLVKATGLPFLIVPFSALDRAGIRQNSIRIVDTLPDRYTWEPRTRDEAPSDYEREHKWSGRNWRQLENGQWSYEAEVHHLGEAVFTAEYEYWHREPAYTDPATWRTVWPEGEYIRGTAYFLSAFDENEPGFGLYFLAQLPADAEPRTVAEAREDLKPQEVLTAEAAGDEVLRQGDVFALQSYLGTRDLQGPSKHSEYVLGVNHQVTEVRVNSYGETFGRGFMRHRPRESWRRPEHRMLKLGNGKDWYMLVKNLVPEGRSWSVGGQVD
jgi:hypothetical protein